MEPIFFQLAAILLIAFIVSYIVKSLKQPVVIGYILAGVLISPFLIKFGATTEIIHIFSKIGIAFLLFIVGLHLNPKVIKEIGVQSLLIGLAQIILTFGLVFLLSYFVLGLEVVSSMYVGIALAFSSTIIIMKLLSDKHQLDSLYGKLAIGILIIQDLVAVAVLMFVSSMDTMGSESTAFSGLLFGAGAIVLLFLLGFFILPRLMKSVARSQELLFLFSICWCFLLAALFSYLGFSIEIGALLAGMILSLSPYSTEISSKIRPLRDFFLIIFFIILGLNIQVTNLSSIIVNAVILSAFVLIFKPIILMFFMALFQYTKRTNFLTGTTLAQISEFSLIVLTLGVAAGHIPVEILYTLTLTLVITIFASSYMIIYSNKFYQKMFKFASVFERKKIKKSRKIKKYYDTILFGYNRIGFSILKSLKKLDKKYLVVDFNPDTIGNLNKFRVPCLYGDVDDVELLDELPLENVNLVISTMPDFETNFLLIETVRLVNADAVIICRAHTVEDALELYKKGADYVLTPHFLGGDFLSKTIKDNKDNRKKYEVLKKKHLKELKDISKHSQGRLRIDKHSCESFKK